MFKREVPIMEKHLLVLTPIRKELEAAGAVVAGGAVSSIFTSRKVNDLDIYVDQFASGPVRAAMNEMISSSLCNAKMTFQTNRAISYNIEGANVQLITKYSADECLDKFDFTVTQGLYKLSTQEFEMRPRFLADNAQRRLVYTGGSEYPICALFRTKKYQARGYTLSGGEMVKIAFAINKLNLNNMTTLKDQLMGIDTVYLNTILSSLEIKYGSIESADITLDKFSQLWDEMMVSESLELIDDLVSEL